MTPTPSSHTMAEVRAIRLLVAGDRPRDVAATTGLSVDEVERLRAETPGADGTHRIARLGLSDGCTSPGCGQPRRGRPPLGWVKVTVAGRGDSLWHCGWVCARRYIDRKAAS